MKRCPKSFFFCKCSSIIQFWWHTATFGSSSAMLWPCFMGKLWVCFSQDCTFGHDMEGAMRQQDWRVCFPFLLPSATKELNSTTETYLNLKSSQMSTFTVQQRHLPAWRRHWFQAQVCIPGMQNLAGLYKISIYWLRFIIYWPIHWSTVTGKLVSPTLD